MPAWNPDSGHLNVIVDTPQGSAVKFKYDSSNKIFKISHLLPPGTVFPFDFGSVPSTLAQDGDPLDLLILMEQPSFAGCLVEVRLIGVIEAEQTQDDKTQRNDRLIGVAVASRFYETIRTSRTFLLGGLQRSSTISCHTTKSVKENSDPSAASDPAGRGLSYNRERNAIARSAIKSRIGKSDNWGQVG